jgi:hypothetical protein
VTTFALARHQPTYPAHCCVAVFFLKIYPWALATGPCARCDPAEILRDAGRGGETELGLRWMQHGLNLPCTAAAAARAECYLHKTGGMRGGRKGIVADGESATDSADGVL